MKQLSLLFLVLLLFFLITGCNKKNDGPAVSYDTSGNGFTLNGTFYHTPNGVYVHDGDSVFSFMFYTSSITFDHGAQQFVGKGDAIEISDLNTNTVQNHFPHGTFQYNYEGGSGYFDDGGTAKGYSFDEDTGYMVYCVRGTVTISSAGTAIKINYTFHNEDSTFVTGSFTGNPQDISSWIRARRRR
jgi:hypothetical protein